MYILLMDINLRVSTEIRGLEKPMALKEVKHMFYCTVCTVRDSARFKYKLMGVMVYF
jgi:hypothetical protein